MVEVNATIDLNGLQGGDVTILPSLNDTSVALSRLEDDGAGGLVKKYYAVPRINHEVDEARITDANLKLHRENNVSSRTPMELVYREELGDVLDLDAALNAPCDYDPSITWMTFLGLSAGDTTATKLAAVAANELEVSEIIAASNLPLLADIVDLNDIDTLFTGEYNFHADGSTFPVRVYKRGDSASNPSYIQIARGREGWGGYNNNGKGNVNLVKNHGTPAEFNSAYYSQTIVNELLSNSGVTDLSQIEILIRRATDNSGKNFQEITWILHPGVLTGWSWDLDAPNRHIAFYEIFPSDLDGGESDSLIPGVDGTALFTSPMAATSHVTTVQSSTQANFRGFQYILPAGVIPGGTGANDFIYDVGASNPIPYAEVYIRKL